MAVRFDHAEYIQGDHWRERRTKYYSTHARRCRSCGTKRKGTIHLHHLSYDNVYAEPDEDLMPLCRGCHSDIHEFHRSIGGSLRHATLLGLPWTGRAIYKREHPPQPKKGKPSAPKRKPRKPPHVWW